MSSFIIEGGKKLEGEVKISGSKNASLPIIAARVLLLNILSDTRISIVLLRLAFLLTGISLTDSKINSIFFILITYAIKNIIAYTGIISKKL